MPRKNLDASIADLAHAIGLLMRHVRAASASHELSWTESAVMGRLAKDGPATTADLARAEAMKPQSMGATEILRQPPLQLPAPAAQVRRASPRRW